MSQTPYIKVTSQAAFASPQLAITQAAPRTLQTTLPPPLPASPLSHRLPGPQFYYVMRTVLVVFTLVSATLCTAAVLMAMTSTPAGGIDVLAVIVTILACAAFLVAMIVTARRSHRVINLGLAIGLAAAATQMVVFLTYAASSFSFGVWYIIIIETLRLIGVIAPLTGLQARIREYS
ncbi:MAG: hypothetical protein LBE83_06360 [Propionibacteriaceae bacterium]|jgi:hypothetical protein|nr:hypothetical protein [Propionibacteriaceae bacterium]